MAAVFATGRASASTPIGSAATATKVVDTIHGPVEVPVSPRRVVCIGFVDTACLLDLGVVPVGISTWGVSFLPDYEEVLADIPEIADATGLGLNLELIASLEPDLIIGSDWLDPAQQSAPYDELSAIAPTALCEWQQAAGNWPDQDAWFADVLGRTAQLDALRNDFERAADDIADRHGAALAASRWALVQGGADQWFAYTAQSSHGQVFVRAGVQLTDFVDGETAGVLALSYEQLAELQSADAIALNVNVSAADGADILGGQPLWAGLPAVAAERVYPMNWFFPSSYRVATALLGELDTALTQLEAAPTTTAG